MVLAGIEGFSAPALLAIVLGAALMVRFNRPLARAHAALFAGSRAAPRWWQMALLRLVWFAAGAALFALVAVALIDIADA
jgi:hypothetical protein